MEETPELETTLLFRTALAVALLILAAAPPPAAAIDPGLAVSQLARQVWQDELPQNTVHTILQSRDGYLWLGTYEGLVRFDGARFVIFDLHRTRHLQGSSVLDLAEDDAGRLWLATNGGLTRVEGGDFRTWSVRDGLPSRMVRTLLVARDGTLWVGTDHGLAERRGDTLKARPELEDGEVFALAEGPDGTLWVGTAEGLLRLGADGSQLRLGVADGLPAPVCRALLVDRSGNLWVGTDEGLARWLGEGRGFAVLRAGDGLGDDYVRALFEDGDGVLWVGTETAGLVRVRGDRFERFAAADGLTHDYVRVIFEDRERNLWVGTSGGLNRFRAGKFTNVGTAEGLAHDFARVVLADRDDVLWVGTDGGGVSRLAGGRWLPPLTAAQGLSHDSVRALAEDAEGAVWVGTRDGLERVRGEQVTSFGHLLRSRLVRALLADPDGTLWVGAEAGGLMRLRGGEARAFGAADGLGADDVRALHRDRRGRLWVGTYGGGLARLEGERFVTLRTAQGLPNDIVFTFHEDAEGLLWIGTDSGLAVLRDGRLHAFGIDDGLYDEKVFRILEDGRGELWMSSNRGIFRARRADLLAFADGRLERIPSTGYNRSDGMRASQCNGTSQPAGARTRDGRLWFPTVRGLVAVDPGDLRTNRLPPPVVIEEVRVDGAGVELADGGELPSHPEQLEIAFTALSFVAPERVRFRYRLEGSDSGWVEAGNRRTAYYTYLAPGRYRFAVTAANDDGVWNDSGASLAFTVATPLAQTWWAWALYLATLGGAVSSVVWWRFRALARANALLEARVAERTAALDEKVRQLEASERRAHQSEALALDASRAKTIFLSNMSHELRTPLNSILGFAQILEERMTGELSEQHRHFLANIHRSGQHLLDLINDLLDLSKIEAGRMELRTESVEAAALLHEVRELIRGVSEERGIEVDLELLPRLPSLVADAGKLRQVLLNLLSNAVKFSSRGSRVRVRAQPVGADQSPLAQEGLRIDVIDHGIGIAREHQAMIFEEFRQVESDLARSSEGTGLGLALVRRLLDLQGGLVTVESELGRGSTFTVYLPRQAPVRARAKLVV